MRVGAILELVIFQLILSGSSFFCHFFPDYRNRSPGPPLFDCRKLRLESELLTSRSWTPEQVECLERLLANKVSPARAAVILRRSIVSVQVKARALGKPFPNMRKERVARNAAAAAFSENRIA